MGNTSSQWDNGRAHTDKVAREVLDRFPVYWMWVLGATGHHKAGRAIDFMTLTDDQKTLRTPVGNSIAAYLRANHRRLGVEYIIWRRRIWNATRSDDAGRLSWSTWRLMEDRGSTTANHMDHVHVSLLNSPPAYQPPQGGAPEEDIMASLADLKKALSEERAHIASAVLHTDIKIPAETAKAYGYTRPSRAYKLFELVADCSWRIRELQKRVSGLSVVQVPKETQQRWAYSKGTYPLASIVLDASWKSRACEERLRHLAAAMNELIELVEPGKQETARRALALAMANAEGEPDLEQAAGEIPPGEDVQ